MDLYVTCSCCGRLIHATVSSAKGTKSLCYDCATLPKIEKMWPDPPKEEQYIKRTWTPEWDL